MSCAIDSLHYLLINHGKYSQPNDLKSAVNKMSKTSNSIDEELVKKVLEKYGLTFFKHLGDPFLPVSYILCNGTKWISIIWDNGKFRSNEEFSGSALETIEYLRENEFFGGFYVLPVKNELPIAKKKGITNKGQKTDKGEKTKKI